MPTGFPPIAAGLSASRKRSRFRSRILEVGCGNGVPVTEALVNAGYRVVGLDSSAGMLARFQANLPGTSVAIIRPFVALLAFRDKMAALALSLQ